MATDDFSQIKLLWTAASVCATTNLVAIEIQGHRPISCGCTRQFRSDWASCVNLRQLVSHTVGLWPHRDAAPSVERSHPASCGHCNQRSHPVAAAAAADDDDDCINVSLWSWLTPTTVNRMWAVGPIYKCWRVGCNFWSNNEKATKPQNFSKNWLT